MTRQELIRLLVLAEISDDYEEPCHILERVARSARICGASASVEDVRSALLGLITSGLARAYWLSPREDASEFNGIPPAQKFSEYYYYITPKGKHALAASRSKWPFDPEGSLLPGWTISVE